MPFSLSHAGFILPLRRRVPSTILFCLIIGSITPDFGYFIRQFDLATFAHTTLGALTISTPLGLLIYFLVNRFYQPAILNLPKPHSEFLASFSPNTCSASPPVIMGAIFLGALSHNFVDSFTHESGFAVSLFPLLQKPTLSITGEPIPLYRILQYSGSIIGMLMIALFYFISFRRFLKIHPQPIWQDKASWTALLLVISISSGIAILINSSSLSNLSTFFSLRAFGFRFLITWIPLFLLGHCLWAYFASRKRHATPPLPSRRLR